MPAIPVYSEDCDLFLNGVDLIAIFGQNKEINSYNNVLKCH